MARTRYHHGDLAPSLKALALQVIAEQGVARLSLRDAAAALGVAPSAVYRHFADKADLLGALAIDGFAELGARTLAQMATAERDAGTDPGAVALARFAASADAYVQFAMDRPALFQLMYGPFGTGAFGMARLDETGVHNPFQMLSAALDGLVDAGVIPVSARPRAEVKAYAAIHGMASLLVSGVFDALAPDQIRERLDLVKANVFSGLVGGGGPACAGS
jgi:AcrR family transcriptional regulator